MIASVGSKVARAVTTRNFSTTLQRLDAHGPQQWPKPGSNLPFSIKNRYKLTLYYCLFAGSAFGLPFYFWTQKV
ncbi:uncharacterized protein LOC113214234 [Frankliniella occidentalis]|uniref:Uncharacterized protein LOC113214234 n=1 Tax=Frankliniella occidentalis TaxID=133901 RepID=A0A6J1T8Z4_FRAOC|nr:uncharacterized protein LOC113214234 [Frankliniella occidentalis]